MAHKKIPYYHPKLLPLLQYNKYLLLPLSQTQCPVHGPLPCLDFSTLWPSLWLAVRVDFWQPIRKEKQLRYLIKCIASRILRHAK